MAQLQLHVGEFQYRQAQFWRQSEFVAAEVEKLFARPRVATALLLLDYSRNKLKPDGTRANRDEPGVVFDDALGESSLRVHRDLGAEAEHFTSDEIVAREAFDELLTGLEKFYHFVQAGLVEANDFRPYLAYWFNVMANPSSGRKEASFYETMSQFIRAYRYDGVTELIRRLQPAAFRSPERPPAGEANDRG